MSETQREREEERDRGDRERERGDRERKRKKVICRELPRQRIRLQNLEIESRREDFKVVKVRDTHTHVVYTHTHSSKHTESFKHQICCTHTYIHSI